jgi:hypothetical protein
VGAGDDDEQVRRNVELLVRKGREYHDRGLDDLQRHLADAEARDHENDEFRRQLDEFGQDGGPR